MALKIPTTVDSISSLMESVELINALLPPIIWWRGQPRAGKLRPRVCRNINFEATERSLFLEFQAKAPTRYANCPRREDDPTWLFLMQHYSLPTRLLDWSESPLIALFFAVTKDLEESGTLSALNPVVLNMSQQIADGIITASHPIATKLFEPLFKPHGTHSPLIAAIGSQEIDIRMLVQFSQFTYHGTDKPLEQLDAHRKFLIQLNVPKEAKSLIRSQLSQLGIRQSNIFPDLQSLAQELAGKYDYGVYGPIEPGEPIPLKPL